MYMYVHVCMCGLLSLGIGSVGHSADPSCHAELMEGDWLTNLSKDGAIVFRNNGESLHQSLRRESKRHLLLLSLFTTTSASPFLIPLSTPLSHPCGLWWFGDSQQLL